MEFLILLANAKTAYSTYKTINDIFVDKTKEVMRAISEKELRSAIKTLDDIKHSNDKEREFSSAITQLRLALEKMDSDAINKWKTALLIALCYKAINESSLSLKFGDRAIEYFSKYIEEQRRWALSPAKDMWKHECLLRFVCELESIGIKHKDKEPKKSFFEILWSGYNSVERVENVVREARKEFAIAVENLLAAAS